MIQSKVTFLLLFINISPCFLQQIFREKHSFCTFTNTEAPKSERTISVENTLWDITGTRRDKDTHVKLSLCGTLVSTNECDPNAAICIFNTKNAARNIKNAGEYFEYKVENGKNILQSINGEKCDDGSENFTVIIQFESNPGISVKPKFIFMDDCELRLEMMWPMYTPPCTVKENGNLIDLRSLQNSPNFLTSELKTNRTYSLSVCKKSDVCGQDISACEITGSGPMPISSIEHNRVTYDERHGLVLKSYYGNVKRGRRFFELHLKCNWKSDGITNLIAVAAPGKTFRFKGESSLACIKFPTDCLVRDKVKSNFLYDLNRLNKNYEVRNVTTGSIKINVCASLNMPPEKNDCTELHAQVCYQSTTNEIKSLGSIPKNFEVTTHYTVKGSFQDGNICASNTSLTYTTEIEFICKSEEDGPILEAIDGCTYKIKWFTPAACPINSPQGDNCVLSDLTGIVNLQKMYKTTDRKVAVSQNSILRYNLCGSLTLPCDNHTDAAVCYVEGGTEKVVGLQNKHLVLENNVISLNMPEQGRKNKCNTKVKFYCNQMITPNEGEQVQVNIIRDKCNFEIIVETPLACGTSSTSNCTFVHNNLLYNLTGISRKDSNYLITKENKVFMLNICRSVIKLDDAVCPAYSGICMKDSDVPDLRNRYKSLGSINTDVVPTFDNNDLVITYKEGSYCPEADSLARTSSIRFQCSTTEEGPQLVQEDACHHEFHWRTPQICPIRISSMKPRSHPELCHYFNTIDGNIINLSNVKLSPKLSITNSSSYKLDLCSSVYLECKNETESSCTPKNSVLEIFSNTSHLYLSYLLDHECSPNKIPNVVHVHLICDYDADYFDTGSMIDCVFNINLKTDAVCPTVYEKPHIEKEPCTNSGLQSFDLQVLKNTKITSVSGTVYTLNFDNTESSCSDFICKGGFNMIPHTVSKCPFVEYNYTDAFVLLKYKSEQACDHGTDTYEAEIHVKCNLELDVPNIIEETNCKVVFQYPVNEVCSLFNLKTVMAGSSSAAVGSSVGLVALAVFLIGGFIFYKKRKKDSYNRIATANKQSTRIYMRDTEE